jgi:hypothetical protein
MSFALIDAGGTQKISFTLERDKRQCKNCKDSDEKCEDMIDPSVNLRDLDHVYKSSTKNCYAPEPLERWWNMKITDPVSNLPADEISVRQARHQLRRIQEEKKKLQTQIIDKFRSVCGWMPLRMITTHPDRKGDGTVKLTFERVYFNGTHLESMTTDDLRTTLKTLRDVRPLNPVFEMDEWMPLAMADDVKELSEKYHSMLDENIRGIRVRFGVDHDNEKLPGVWLSLL